jgi:seryl-tRNA synthetase
MMANPVLKAVHAGLNATPIERYISVPRYLCSADQSTRDLRPLIEERDNLSVSLTETSAKFLSTVEKLTNMEAEHVIVARKNADLATKMIALAEEADSQKKEDIKDPSVRAQLDELEEALKVSRQRWRIMKGTASAVVVGSGIDWSRDPALRELVLDIDGD